MRGRTSERFKPSAMTDLPHDRPEDSIAGKMVRDLGVAPALSTPDAAAEALVEEARAETDEIVERRDEKEKDAS